MMEFINQQFPTIFKPSEGAVGAECAPGQKVVCTPEVSLYQYNSEITPNGLTRLEDKTAPGGNPDNIPSNGIRVAETETGSTSSTGGFQCGFCGKSFQQKNTFQNHLRSHREGEDPYQCDICGKTFAVPARLTRHYRTHTGEKPYQCEYCNKSFSVKENLSVHRRIHTKERPYKCEVCERAFEHSGKLHRHMRIHTGERPHRCQICQKTFIQSGQLVIHMRTHTGEKPYVCKVCNKGFTCSKQLKVHTRTHTGEKPYTCDICGKSFGYNHVLKLHQVAHYGEKVYKCTLCNGTFNSKKSLETHIKTHSEGSLPNEPSSPMNQVEVINNMSPSSLSQTPPNSDKENRESSDSEISSQNSPHVEPPKTPPSPVIYSNTSPRLSQYQHHHQQQQQFKPNSQGTNFYRGSGNNNSYINRDSTSSSSHGSNNNNIGIKLNPATNLPYPMLPPGVQVHQSPQSRTTFLYVTSKLPVHPVLNTTNGSNQQPNGPSSNRSDSPPPPSNNPPHRHFNQIHSSPPSSSKPTIQFNSSANTPNNFKAFGGLLSNGSSVSKTSVVNTNEAPVQRDKLFLANASLRDKKVLPFLEQFGYGLPKESVVVQQNSSFNFNRKLDYERESRQLNGEMASMHTIPENLSVSPTHSSHYSNSRMSGHMRQEYCRSPTEMSSRHSSDSRDRSPEIIEYNSSSNYTPGGVLALALTRGSKAVMQNGGQFSNNNFRQQVTTPPRSNTGSPEVIIGLDFSSSRRSVSPNRNSLASLTPTSTPRSTPGLSESAEELSDEHSHHKSSEEEMNNNDISISNGGGGKRARSSSSGGGPRKRSSLILEKYAQENPGTPAPQPTNESILSQRLRLSSVIQYAEKCS